MSSVADDDLLMDALRAGAAGYLEKQLVSDSNAERLGRMILAAAYGSALFTGANADWLGSGYEYHAQPSLTEREKQVKRLVERGLPDKRVAADLCISVKTVEKHVGAILRKTGARNRTELAARAGAADRGVRRPVACNPITVTEREDAKYLEREVPVRSA
jgi:DNA-binding NarL/FixJ family response regulator